MGSRRRGYLNLQGWILVARTLCFSIALLLLCSSLSVDLLFWSIVIGLSTAAILIKNRQELLRYSFLASSTMWTGAAVSIALAGGDGVAILFALCLSAVDSGFFISATCRGVRR